MRKISIPTSEDKSKLLNFKNKDFLDKVFDGKDSEPLTIEINHDATIDSSSLPRFINHYNEEHCTKIIKFEYTGDSKFINEQVKVFNKLLSFHQSNNQETSLYYSAHIDNDSIIQISLKSELFDADLKDADITNVFNVFNVLFDKLSDYSKVKIHIPNIEQVDALFNIISTHSISHDKILDIELVGTEGSSKETTAHNEILNNIYTSRVRQKPGEVIPSGNFNAFAKKIVDRKIRRAKQLLHSGEKRPLNLVRNHHRQRQRQKQRVRVRQQQNQRQLNKDIYLQRKKQVEAQASRQEAGKQTTTDSLTRVSRWVTRENLKSYATKQLPLEKLEMIWKNLVGLESDAVKNMKLKITRVSEVAFNRILAHATEFNFGLNFYELPNGFIHHADSEHASLHFDEKYKKIGEKRYHTPLSPRLISKDTLKTSKNVGQFFKFDREQPFADQQRAYKDFVRINQIHLNKIYSKTSSLNQKLSSLVSLIKLENDEVSIELEKLKKYDFNERNIQALTNLICQYGSQQVVQLLNHLDIVQKNKPSYYAFKKAFIDNRDDLSEFVAVKKEFKVDMTGIEAISFIQTLSPNDKLWWEECVKQHVQHDPKASLTDLASAFKYFLESLKNIDSTLKLPDKFPKIEIKNFKTGLSRFLKLLKKSIDPHQQMKLLDELDFSMQGFISGATYEGPYVLITKNMQISPKTEKFDITKYKKYFDNATSWSKRGFKVIENLKGRNPDFPIKGQYVSPIYKKKGGGLLTFYQTQYKERLFVDHRTKKLTLQKESGWDLGYEGITIIEDPEAQDEVALTGGDSKINYPIDETKLVSLLSKLNLSHSALYFCYRYIGTQVFTYPIKYYDEFFAKATSFRGPESLDDELREDIRKKILLLTTLCTTGQRTMEQARDIKTDVEELVAVLEKEETLSKAIDQTKNDSLEYKFVKPEEGDNGIYLEFNHDNKTLFFTVKTSAGTSEKLSLDILSEHRYFKKFEDFKTQVNKIEIETVENIFMEFMDEIKKNKSLLTSYSKLEVKVGTHVKEDQPKIYFRIDHAKNRIMYQHVTDGKVILEADLSTIASEELKEKYKSFKKDIKAQKETARLKKLNALFANSKDKKFFKQLIIHSLDSDNLKSIKECCEKSGMDISSLPIISDRKPKKDDVGIFVSYNERRKKFSYTFQLGGHIDSYSPMHFNPKEYEIYKGYSNFVSKITSESTPKELEKSFNTFIRNKNCKEEVKRLISKARPPECGFLDELTKEIARTQIKPSVDEVKAIISLTQDKFIIKEIFKLASLATVSTPITDKKDKGEEGEEDEKADEKQADNSFIYTVFKRLSLHEPRPSKEQLKKFIDFIKSIKGYSLREQKLLLSIGVLVNKANWDNLNTLESFVKKSHKRDDKLEFFEALIKIFHTVNIKRSTLLNIAGIKKLEKLIEKVKGGADIEAYMENKINEYYPGLVIVKSDVSKTIGFLLRLIKEIGAEFSDIKDRLPKLIDQVKNNIPSTGPLANMKNSLVTHAEKFIKKLSDEIEILITLLNTTNSESDTIETKSTFKQLKKIIAILENPLEDFQKDNPIAGMIAAALLNNFLIKPAKKEIIGKIQENFMTPLKAELDQLITKLHVEGTTTDSEGKVVKLSEHLKTAFNIIPKLQEERILDSINNATLMNERLEKFFKSYNKLTPYGKDGLAKFLFKEKYFEQYNDVEQYPNLEKMTLIFSNFKSDILNIDTVLPQVWAHIKEKKTPASVTQVNNILQLIIKNFADESDDKIEKLIDYGLKNYDNLNNLIQLKADLVTRPKLHDRLSTMVFNGLDDLTHIKGILQTLEGVDIEIALDFLENHLLKMPTDTEDAISAIHESATDFLEFVNAVISNHPDNAKYCFKILNSLCWSKSDSTVTLEQQQSLVENAKFKENIKTLYENIFKFKPRPSFEILLDTCNNKIDIKQWIKEYELDPFNNRNSISERYQSTGINFFVSNMRNLMDKSSLPLDKQEELVRACTYITSIGKNYELPVYDPETKSYDLVKPVSKFTRKELKANFQDCITRHRAGNASARYDALAILCEVMFRTTGKFPFHSQIMSTLSTILYDDNMLLQIQTGQGKTMTLALIAAMSHSFSDPATHLTLCSSNILLARKDFEENKNFYDYLDIPCSFVTASTEDNVYEKPGIVYSTVSDKSLYDSARKISHNDEPKKYHQTLICDEVDSEFFDNKNAFNFSDSDEDPYHNPLEWVYPLANAFIKDPVFQSLAVSEQEDIALFRQRLKNKNPSSYKQFEEILTDARLSKIINAACDASTLKENIDFIIRTKTRIVRGAPETISVAHVLVDHLEDTEATLSNGVQQALHARLNVKYAKKIQQYKQPDSKNAIPPFSCDNEIPCVDSQTSFSFFKKFSRIIGATGTAGSSIELKEAQTKLGIKTMIDIPPRRKSKLAFLSDIFVAPHSNFFTGKNHLKAIIRDLKKHRRQPVLLSCADIDTADAWAEQLKRKFPDKVQVIHAIVAEDQEKFNELVKDASKAGMITVVTPLAGRGVDIKTARYEHNRSLSRCANKITALREKLYVIETDLDTYRRRRQLQGRSAREGRAGETRAIFNLDSIAAKYNVSFKGKYKSHQKVKVLKQIMDKMDLEAAIERNTKICIKSIQISGQNEFDKLINKPKSDRKRILAAKADFIHQAEKLWNEIIADEDPEGVHKNPYVRYKADGAFDLVVINKMLKTYKTKVQQLFDKTINPFVEKSTFVIPEQKLSESSPLTRATSSKHKKPVKVDAVQQARAYLYYKQGFSEKSSSKGKGEDGPSKDKVDDQPRTPSSYLSEINSTIAKRIFSLPDEHKKLKTYIDQINKSNLDGAQAPLSIPHKLLHGFSKSSAPVKDQLKLMQYYTNKLNTTGSLSKCDPKTITPLICDVLSKVFDNDRQFGLNKQHRLLVHRVKKLLQFVKADKEINVHTAIHLIRDVCNPEVLEIKSNRFKGTLSIVSNFLQELSKSISNTNTYHHDKFKREVFMRACKVKAFLQYTHDRITTKGYTNTHSQSVRKAKILDGLLKNELSASNVASKANLDDNSRSIYHSGADYFDMHIISPERIKKNLEINTTKTGDFFNKQTRSSKDYTALKTELEQDKSEAEMVRTISKSS